MQYYSKATDTVCSIKQKREELLYIRTIFNFQAECVLSLSLSLCVSALENHLLTKSCSHFLVASYTLSLLQVYFEPATLLNRAATTPGTSCPTLFDKCVGSLTSRRILELKEL